MRITKARAYDIAIALSNKKKQAFELAKKEYYDFVAAEYLKQTPELVLEAYRNYPEWVKTTRQVNISGPGLSYENVVTDAQNVYNYRDGAKLAITPELGALLIKARRKIETAEDVYDDLVKSISVALEELRTYAKIAEHFPEAVPFLPAIEKRELMINFDALRKKL